MSKCVCEKSSSADPNGINTCAVCEENLKRDVLSVAIQFVYALMDMQMFHSPPKETCPVCSLLMPHGPGQWCGVTIEYQPCCGKRICTSCVIESQAKKPRCPICKLPMPRSYEEHIERYKTRMKVNDAKAFYELGCAYQFGHWGLPRNITKALDLWHQAAQFGSCEAHESLAMFHVLASKSIEMANYHWKIAALSGHELAHSNLGTSEYNEGNMDQAMKHFTVAAKVGGKDALDAVRELFMKGYMAKDDYINILRAYNDSQRTLCRSSTVQATNSIINTMSDTLLCARCGEEEGDDDLKFCAGCKLVKYCSRECQSAHRPQHKKECKKRAAELHLLGSMSVSDQITPVSDEILFKQPPPKEDCQICFLPMPLWWTGYKYMACCGKILCSGCIYAPVYDNQGNKVAEEKCPFCRTPVHTTDKELVERYKKRMEVNDAEAIFTLGCFYGQGSLGFPQNTAKALELWHRAGEFGHTHSYYNIGTIYYNGNGVERDEEKALRYFEIAAINGHIGARHNLGVVERKAGNMDRALKHWMISAGLGHGHSLKNIQNLFRIGQATKNDYAHALRSHQAYLDKIKSHQRDEAAAASDEYEYYSVQGRNIGEVEYEQYYFVQGRMYRRDQL